MVRLFLFSVFLLACVQLDAKVFYADPVYGKISNDGTINAPWPSLEEIINAGFIETQKYSTPYDPLTSNLSMVNQGAPVSGGDTIYLLTGLHGIMEVTNAHNTAKINILALESHKPVLKRIHIRSGSNWNFENLEVSGEPFGELLENELIDLETHGWQGPVHNISISDCFLYSILDSSPWTLEDWNTKSRSGIRIDADSVQVRNCHLLNVNFGISMIGDSILAVGNTIENFSGDGMRALGPNLLLEGNIIKNCYDVNENHDDGIQSFNLGTNDTRNIVIRGNLIINNEDPNQPFAGPLQGIGCFDGPYHNWTIENNVVYVNHYHGISLYGAYDCKIINNTVIDPTPDMTPGPIWIRINPHKDGTPSENNIVANNITNKVVTSGSTDFQNLLLSDTSSYELHFQDFGNRDFYLTESSTAIDAGNADYFPMIDFQGTARPQGSGVDLGAFEYLFTSSIFKIEKEEISIFPNPSSGYLYLDDESTTFTVFNTSGQVVFAGRVENGVLDLTKFSSGIYWLSAKGYRPAKIVILKD